MIHQKQCGQSTIPPARTTFMSVPLFLGEKYITGGHGYPHFTLQAAAGRYQSMPSRGNFVHKTAFIVE
jgi:hypothetical protein